MTEAQVLKELGIPDFRHLNKNHVIKLASNLHKMDPEVAKAALEQFPEFSRAVGEVVKDYSQTIDNILEKNTASNLEAIKAGQTILEGLKPLLQNDSLEFEQKKYIIEQMNIVLDKINAKDSENKKFLAFITKSKVWVACCTLVTMALGVGGTVYLNNKD